MKEMIKVSSQAVSKPKFEVALVGALAASDSGVFLILETENSNETIVKRINAKSLIGLLSLELKGGEIITVQAVDGNEEQAIKIVKQFLCD